MIHMYNKNKKGVDIPCSMVPQHTCSRKSRRWPQAIFYNNLDPIIHNSFTLYRKYLAPNITRRNFCKMLVNELAKEYRMSRHSDLNGLSSSTQHKVRRPLGNIIIQTLSMLKVILIKKIKIWNMYLGINSNTLWHRQSAPQFP